MLYNISIVNLGQLQIQHIIISLVILGVFTVDFRIRELYMFLKRLASVSERLGELREHSFFCRVSGTHFPFPFDP
jgi:hypothetical protein